MPFAPISQAMRLAALSSSRCAYWLLSALINAKSKAISYATIESRSLSETSFGAKMVGNPLKKYSKLIIRRIEYWNLICFA